MYLLHLERLYLKLVGYQLQYTWVPGQKPWGANLRGQLWPSNSKTIFLCNHTVVSKCKSTRYQTPFSVMPICGLEVRTSWFKVANLRGFLGGLTFTPKSAQASVARYVYEGKVNWQDLLPHQWIELQNQTNKDKVTIRWFCPCNGGRGWREISSLYF